ncbi:hypothetical protein ONZ45_g11994 [Pleurotus djamor]|nr:hypothetical protein ONZ45_g11994 [Pleurotus djamor]
MANNAPPTQPRRQAEEPEQSTVQKFIGIAQQVFIVWALTQIATNYFAKKPASTAPPSTTGQAGVPVDPKSLMPTQAISSWPLGIPLDMHVYLSTSPNGDVFSRKWTSGYRKDVDEGLPNFVWENITWGDWNEARSVEFDVKFPEPVLRNGSLWADVFLAKDGSNPDPQSPQFNPEHIHHVRKLLTPYLPKVKIRKEKNLLSGSDQVETEEVEEPDVIVPHWHKVGCRTRPMGSKLSSSFRT